MVGVILSVASLLHHRYRDTGFEDSVKGVWYAIDCSIGVKVNRHRN